MSVSNIDSAKQNRAFSESLGRTPPQDLRAEEGILASVLLDNMVIGDIIGIILPDDLYVARNRTIFKAMVALAEEKKPIDAITLGDQLGADLDACGGHKYLMSLFDLEPTSLNATRYAEIVYRCSARRKFISLATESVIEAFKEPRLNFVARFDARFSGFMREILRTEDDGAVELAIDQIEADLHDGESSRRVLVPTGLAELDDALDGGLGVGLNVPAALTSFGKTMFAGQLQRNAAKRKIGSLYLSQEVRKEALLQRYLAAEAKVPYHRIRRKELSEFDLGKIEAVAAEMRTWPFRIVVSSGLTPGMVRVHIQRSKRELPNLQLVVVDYLQLMELSAEQAKKLDREKQISTICRHLEVIAHQENIAMVLLCQLNRQTWGDGRPKIYHLRESGAIENHADSVIFIHRDGIKNGEVPRNEGITELIVAKQREGKTGSVKVWQNFEYQTFTDNTVVELTRSSSSGRDGGGRGDGL